VETAYAELTAVDEEAAKDVLSDYAAYSYSEIRGVQIEG